jgi:hypothetical protein
MDNDEIIHKHRDSIIAMKEKPLGFLEIHSMLLLQMLNEARADERAKMAERMKIIESQIPTVGQAVVEDLKHDADIQKAERQRCIEIVKEWRYKQTAVPIWYDDLIAKLSEKVD